MQQPENDLDATRWADYVRTLTHGASRLAIARQTGINQSTISRWFDEKRPQQPSVTAVVEVARAYHGNVLEALVEAGFISSSEAHASAARPLRDISTTALARELSRRASSLSRGA